MFFSAQFIHQYLHAMHIYNTASVLLSILAIVTQLSVISWLSAASYQTYAIIRFIYIIFIPNNK